MFESPNVKKDNEELVDKGKRKILGILGAAAVAGAGSALLRNEDGKNENARGVIPEISKGSLETDTEITSESTRAQIIEQIVSRLEAGDHETYIAAIDFLSSLNAEKVLLQKSMVSMTDLLLDMDGTSKKEVFFLMEHDRLQQKIAGLDKDIAEFQEVIQKSPLYGTDVTVTPKNESLLKEPFKSSNTTRPTST